MVVVHAWAAGGVAVARFTANPEDVYTRWHWGYKPTKVIEINDPLLGHKRLVEMGRLVEIHLRREGPKVVWKVPRKWIDRTYAVFDKDHRWQRIYFIIEPGLRPAVRRDFWQEGAPTHALADVAVAVGGRHGTRDYPSIHVQVIAAVPNLVYLTAKKGDAPNHTKPDPYIHRMGEEGGIEPALCVAADGTLWFAGGSYRAPTPGITQ